MSALLHEPFLATGCYTARRTERNCVVVELSPGATDADTSRYPSTDHQELEDGKVVYYESADLKTVNGWKGKLGGQLCEHVLKKEARQRGVEWDYQLARSAFKLFDFPEGYRLYVKKRGDPHVPRTDAYLFGSRDVTVFRSPKEFFPHLRWLVLGQQYDSDGKTLCDCKYCDSSATQKEINERYPYGAPLPPPKSRLGKRKLFGGTRRTIRERGPPLNIPFKDYTQLYKKDGGSSSVLGNPSTSSGNTSL
ncbi:hypothetical protein BDW22DRAFT_1486898 [Trametopsis cervina]|nr:hypothetical protein BDW22DRAFT_1486898 [Trametopsis cervina]